jgi:hypothetical protein
MAGNGRRRRDRAGREAVKKENGWCAESAGGRDPPSNTGPGGSGPSEAASRGVGRGGWPCACDWILLGQAFCLSCRSRFHGSSLDELRSYGGRCEDLAFEF